jgi:hypothetical protein
MDESNLSDVMSIKPKHSKSNVHLLGQYDPKSNPADRRSMHVKDPYPTQ